MKTKITPSVLKWARESSGYEIDDIVEKISQKQVTVNTITDWEEGSDQPSYAQLKKLTKFYKRPIALFFLPEPPIEDKETSVKSQFRSLPDHYTEKLSPTMRHLIRKALVKRMDLKEIFNSNIPKDISEFKDKIKNINIDNAKKLAAEMRNLLGVTLEEQFSWKDADTALKKWREKIEHLGIWVFKEAFDDEDYSGFYLQDDYFPIIYLNNKESKSRQIFSLFHEFGHFLRGKGGIDFRSGIEEDLSGEYRKEEVFCNQFAGHFLVPEQSFKAIIKTNAKIQDNNVEEIANKYNVSKEVIWRKCRDHNIITRARYKSIHNSSRIQSRTRGSGGGNYYATQKSYLGNKYLTLVFSEYYKHRISEHQLANYLQVKVNSIPTLEGFHLKEGM